MDKKNLKKYADEENLEDLNDDQQKNNKKKNKKKKNKKNQGQAEGQPSVQTAKNGEDIRFQQQSTQNNGHQDRWHQNSNQLPLPKQLNLADATIDTEKIKSHLEEVDQENDSEDEGIEDYKLGGYHPVHIGEVLLERYVIIQKLGWGHFSTVWLARDFKFDTYVALKIQKSAPHYLEAAYDEVEILQKVAREAQNPEWLKCLQEYYKDDKNKKFFTRDDCQVVQLLNSFVYRGPYGNHFCMVFEILGVNLLEIIKRYSYKGIPMHLARVIAKQVLIGLDFLHRFCKVIHTDLKPENVLLCLSQQEIKEIVENGQLNQSVTYKQRILEYQKMHGIIRTNDTQQQQQQQKANNNNNAAEGKDQDNDDLDDDDDESRADEDPALKGLQGKKRKQMKKKLKKKREQLLMKEVEQQQTQSSTTTTSRLHDTTTASSHQADKQPQKSQSMFDNYNGRGTPIDENVKVKIADLGNACWVHHHFASEIQTRQYRSPETILGVYYDTSADIWSFACMIFEMLTGDFLFEPRKGPTFGKNDDHLAQIEELLRKFPKSFALSGKNAKKFLNHEGNLRRIPNLHFWPLKNVLIEKYHLKDDEGRLFDQFMQPMLKCDPLKRASARKMLFNAWLRAPPQMNFKYTEAEFNKYQAIKQLKNADEIDLSANEAEDSDIIDADKEDNSQSVEDEEDKAFYELPNFPQVDKRYVDRSFSNLGYIGFGDGIQLEELDQTSNWQFNEHFKN